jgi:hypothetical protein
VIDAAAAFFFYRERDPFQHGVRLYVCMKEDLISVVGMTVRLQGTSLPAIYIDKGSGMDSIGNGSIEAPQTWNGTGRTGV